MAHEPIRTGGYRRCIATRGSTLAVEGVRGDWGDCRGLKAGQMGKERKMKLMQANV